MQELKSLVPERVAEIYNQSVSVMQESQVLQSVLGGQIHFGYWDENNSDASLAEASDRLTQIMIDKSEVSPGERFCDLGCGVGGPAMRIAKAKGCFVDGITISKDQYEIAKQLAEEAGVSDQVRFIYGNALEMPCDDATYDGGWFFETIFHMGHREALREAYRILKPGAILLIADFSAPSSTTEEFKTFIKENLEAVFISKEDYPGLLDEAGFDLIEIDDITEFSVPHMIPKTKAEISQYETQIRQYADSQMLDGWLQLNERMCENLGYILVKAKRRP